MSTSLIDGKLILTTNQKDYELTAIESGNIIVSGGIHCVPAQGTHTIYLESGKWAGLYCKSTGGSDRACCYTSEIGNTFTIAFSTPSGHGSGGGGYSSEYPEFNSAIYNRREVPA